MDSLKNMKALLIAIFTVIATTSCTIPVSMYIDLESQSSTYKDIIVAKNQVDIVVTVKVFTEDKKRNQKAERAHLTHFQRVLRKTGFINPFSNDSSQLIQVTVTKSTAEELSGFKQNRYKYQLSYINDKMNIFEKETYSHHLYAALLSKEAPKVQVLKVDNVAIGHSMMVEHVLLKFIKKLQKQGYLLE